MRFANVCAHNFQIESCHQRVTARQPSLADCRRFKPASDDPAINRQFAIDRSVRLHFDLTGTLIDDHERFKTSASRRDARLRELESAIADKIADIARKEAAFKEFQAQAEKNLLDLEGRRSEMLLGKIYEVMREVARENAVSVVVSPTGTTLALGQRIGLHAIATFSNGSYRDVTTLVNWSSSNPAVVRVNEAAALTALALGSATITCTSFGGASVTPATVNVP